MIFKLSNKRIILVITAVLCIVVFTIVFVFVRNPSWFNIFKSVDTVNFDDDFIKFMDVSQGDGAIIYSNGYCAVIDLGERAVANDVLDDLAELDVEQIDMLVISHYHTDHIGGFEEISKRYDIRNMIAPSITKYNLQQAKDAKQAVINQGGNFYDGIYGTNFEIGEFKITILGYSNEYDENDRSVYLMAEIEGVKFLFTGDGQSVAEEKLINRVSDIDCDVLKVAHHGSKSSTTDDFLNHTTPKYAVVSSGVGNEYGHPHIETMQALENINAKIYRTDTNGDITFYVNDGKIEIKTEK